MATSTTAFISSKVYSVTSRGSYREETRPPPHDLDLAGTHTQRLTGALDHLRYPVGEQRVSYPLLVVEGCRGVLGYVVRAAEVAMPGCLADVRARGIDARPLGQAGIDGFLHAEYVGTGVAYRGEAAQQRIP